MQQSLDYPVFEDPSNNNNHNFLGASDIEQDVRLGFVRKVLGIVVFQLGLTLSMCYFSAYSAGFAVFVQNPVTLTLSTLMVMLSMSALLCCNMTKEVPANYLMLFLFVRNF
jgi:FtsH-binding integral membrane protein